MIALSSGDKIRGAASAASALDYTIHGFVGSTPTLLANGQLPSTLSDLFTASDTTVITAIIVVNTSSSSTTLNLYLQPSGGTDRRLIPVDLSLASGYSLHYEGGKIKVIDDAGNVLTRTEAPNFLSLSDTPSSFSGEKNKGLIVNTSEDALDYESVAFMDSLGLRNKIINGDFRFGQRGTSFSSPASGSYTLDRWRINYDGSGQSHTVSRQSFTLGQTDVPGEPQYYFEYQVTAAASGQTTNRIEQPIEGVRTLAGQEVVVSGYIKTDSNRSVDLILQQDFGTGGSPSSAVETNLGTINATTSWQKFEFTATLPSISGKTLGSNNDDALILIFDLPTGVTLTVGLARIQVEKGSVATDFEERPKQIELALCQRYYEKSYALDNSPGSITEATGLCMNAFNGYWVRMTVYFAVSKRASPSITLYNPSNGSTTNPIRNADAGSNEAGSATSLTEKGFRVTWQDNSNTTGHFGIVQWVAEAEL